MESKNLKIEVYPKKNKISIDFRNWLDLVTTFHYIILCLITRVIHTSYW